MNNYYNIIYMFKKFFIFICLIFSLSAVYATPELRDYNEFEIPQGYNLPILSLQEFSTAYTEEGELLKFVTTSDIYMFNKNVIPEGTRLTGYIEKKNEPIRGTHASMKVYINKMYLKDGFEIPIKGYIQTANNNLIGGGLTEPETYDRKPHYQRWSMFKAMGVLQCVPGAQRKIGEHVTISAGANLIMVLVMPINMTHTLIN